MKNEKLKQLRSALIDGENSGFIQNFDPQNFKTQLKQRLFVKRDISDKKE